MAETDDFVELYRAHYPRLVGALGLAGAGHAQAQDLAQEAFARTYGHWRRVRRGSNPAGYVYTIAFRLVRRRVQGWDGPLDDNGAAAASGDEEARVEAMTVSAAIAAMPPRRRACATLCFSLGFTGPEAAGILGIEASTVRAQLHRARADLARALGEREPALAE